MSSLHRPGEASEKERIENSNGEIKFIEGD